MNTGCPGQQTEGRSLAYVHLCSSDGTHGACPILQQHPVNRNQAINKQKRTSQLKPPVRNLDPNINGRMLLLLLLQLIQPQTPGRI